MHASPSPPSGPHDLPDDLKATLADSFTAEQRLQLLLESARDYAILSTDPERRIVYWSTGAERLFQYKEAQIVGLSSDLLFTPEDRERGAPQKEAELALRTGRAEDERWHLRLDGSRFYASGVLFTQRAPDGRFVGFVKIARDLTERKIAEEQLRLAHDQLEERVRQRTLELDVANEELRVANEQLRAEMEHRHEAEALRLEAVRRIASVQEEERRRISRELHDELGQHLAALMLGLNALELEPEKLREHLASLQTLTETISREMHALAVQLRPTALEDLGLAGALASFTELWGKRSGIKVELHVSDLEGVRLPQELELSLYRIVQEALTNVMKHANASVVSVIIERRDGEALAIIEDDGVGFDPEALTTPTRGRLGFVGMNERAAQFGGRVNVESAPGRGTTLFVRIPLRS